MSEKLLAEKIILVQRELEGWAHEQSILKPGEQIQFTMKIVKVPTVVYDQSEIGKMKLSEFFTIARFQAAGIATVQAHCIGKEFWVRAGEAFTVRVRYPYEWEQIDTVEELIGLWPRILYADKLGLKRRSKRWQYIRKVLELAGVPL